MVLFVIILNLSFMKLNLHHKLHRNMFANCSRPYFEQTEAEPTRVQSLSDLHCINESEHHSKAWQTVP